MHSLRPSCADSRARLKIVLISHISSRFCAVNSENDDGRIGRIQKSLPRASQGLRDLWVASNECYSSFNHLPFVRWHEKIVVNISFRP